MADKTPVLGQNPIDPTNLNAPIIKGGSDYNYSAPENLKTRLAEIQAMDAGRLPARSVDLPISSQKLNKRLGEYTPIEGVNINENLAQDQSGLEQIAMFIPRAAAKAATEALKLPGYIGGFAEWASTGFDPKEYGNAFNNGWNVALDNFNTSLQEKGLPVYTPESVRDGNIFDKLASTSFWASEGADGVGFLVGMLAPGALLRWASLGQKITGATKVFTAAEKLAMPANEFNAIAKSAKTAAKINDWSSAVINTVYESATEGVQAFNDYLMDHPGDMEGAGRVGSKTFLINNAILIGPNILNQKWLFNGFKRSEGIVASQAVGKSKVAEIIDKSLTITGKLGSLKAPSFFDKTFDIAKTLGKGITTEGLWEEGMQFAASEGAKKGIDVTNPIELINEYISDITADTKGNTEMWSSIVLGGIMGGGMSAYGGAKQQSRENKLASEYHKLLSAGQINYYKTYKDFAKVENGKPVLLENGEYDLDPQKVIEGGKQVLKNAALREYANGAFKKGDKEYYDFLSNIMHFDYMMPWLQIEGGLELLKKHLKSVATTENEKDIEALGVDPKNVDVLHRSLIEKAEKFQNILNKINDTHDLSFDVKLIEGATKDDLAKFSQDLKNSKLSSKVNMDYSADRIMSIKTELASLGIVSTSGRLDSELVKELNSSYEDLKKNKTIDKADQVQIEKNIHSIERLVKAHSDNAIELNDAYDNKKIQIAFNEKIAEKISKQKQKDSVVPEVAADKKAKQSFIKDKELQDLHEANVKVEKWDNINQNIKIWDEESQSTISIPGRARLVTTRGIVKITYKDADNKENSFLAAVGDGNTGGGLDLRIVTEQKDKTFKPDTTRVGMSFLNSATEVALRTDPNSTKFSKFTITKIESYKTADDIQMERQKQAVAQYYQDRIDSEKSNKVSTDEISRLNQEVRRIKTDLKDEIKLHQQDLVKAGMVKDENGIITLNKISSKRVLKIYERISKLQKAVIEKTDHINRIKDNNFHIKEKVAEFKANILALKDSQTLPVNDIKSIMENAEVMEASEKALIDITYQQIDSTKAIIEKSLLMMRLYRSQVAKMLNLDISDNAIGALGLGAEEKNSIIDQMLLDMVDSMWDESTIDSVINTARGLTLKLSDLRQQVSILKDMLYEAQTSLLEHEKLEKQYSKDFGIYKYRYQEIFKLYKKLIPQYFREKDIYNESLVNGKLIEGDNVIDLENSYDDTFKFGYWEIDAKHPFTGFDSYLTITSNQDHAATNEDVMRWFVYVNNFGYKDIERRDTPKHALKTLTYNQISKIESKENIYLKDYIKFYLGKGEYKSYNEIQKISDPTEKKLAEIAASDDIKVILVDFKKIDEVALFTKDGKPEDKYNKGVVPIYSSLGLANIAYKESGYEKFSSKKWMEKWAQAKLKEDPSLTKDELLQLSSDAYDAELEKTKSEFAALRNTLDVSPEILNITGVNRGVKVDTDIKSELEDVVLKEPNWGKMEFIVSSPIMKVSNSEDGTVKTAERSIITKEINGNEYKLTSGETYWLNGTDLEVIQPKMLSETGSVESIFKLFQAIAQNKENSISAVTYLEQALHMLYSTKSDTSKPHRLYFHKARDKGEKVIENKYDSIVFGEYEISMEDLANNKGIEMFKQFLSTKYWNFDKRLINGVTDFSEYFVNKQGEIEERRWVAPGTKDTKGKPRTDSLVGGYQAFLFRGSDTNVTKGTVNLIPMVKQTGDDKYRLAVLNPQYKNKSIRTTLRSSSEEKKTSKKEKKDIDVQSYDITVHTTNGDKSGKIEYHKKKNAIRFIDFTEVTGSKEGDTVILKKVKELIIAKKVSELSKYAIEGTDVSVTVTESIIKEEEIIEKAPKEEKTKGSLSIEDALKGKKKKIITTTTIASANIEKLWSKASPSAQQRAMKKADGNLEKAKEIYLNDINSVNRLARENIVPFKDYAVEKQERVDWFKNKFPSVPIDNTIMGLIEGKSWGQFVKGSRVLISDIAEEGTTYHEAFHVWNYLFNDPDSRIKLYDEVRKKLNNPEMDELDAEEYLAEEFRDFMMMGNEYKFSKLDNEKKSFFQKIVDFFKKLLHIDITNSNKSEIENAFRTISDNTFGEPKFTTDKTFERRIPGIDASRKLAYLKDINYRFFDVLMKEVESGKDTIFDLDRNIQDIYEEVFYTYDLEKSKYEHLEKIAPDYVDDILNNKDLFIHNHLLYLTKYNIDLTHTFLLEDISEDDFGKNKAEWIESNQTSMKDDMPSPIRLLIASLKVIDENDIPVRSDYFTRSNIEYDKIVNLLHNNLSNITTPEGIMNKLNELSKDNIPLRNLYNLLGGNIAASEMTMTQFRLYEQFITSFSSNKADARLYTNNNDGSTTQSNLVTDARKEIVKTKWIDKAKIIAIGKQSKLITISNGEYIINKNTLLNSLRSNIRDFSILKELGIDVNNSLEHSDEVKNYLSSLKNAIEAYPDEVNVNALYDRNKVRNQIELDKLAAKQASLLQNDEDLMYYNAEGHSEWGINRNSHLTDIKNRLNELSDRVLFNKKMGIEDPIEFGESLNNIQPYNSETGEGNLFTNNSLYLDHVLNGGKIELLNLKGMRSQLGSGYDVSDLTPQDYHMLTFDLILNNIIPYRRAADRSVENGFYAMPTNHNLSAKTFIETMSRYLYDEVVTSVALIIESRYNENQTDPSKKSYQFGSKLKNYSKNARSLRTFDFIYNKKFNEGSAIESIESFLKKSDLGEIDIEKIRNLSDKYIKKYESVIYKSFSNFINESVNINKQNLIYSGIIKNKKGRWSIPGINPITIENFKLSKQLTESGLLSDEAMGKLLLVHAYNFFVGVQEQHKIAIGDIAFFDNMGSSNKRTKSFNSTREKTPNDTKTIELLNNYLPKITGLPHLNVVNQVIVNTIRNDASKDITALYNEYKGMKTADGAQLGTLDFIRGYQGRRGLWNDNLERTYQYEMQLLVKRILDNEEFMKLAPWASTDMINEDGIPRFNGEIIDPYDIKTMGQIPPIKTQASGYLANDLNVGVSVIDKMAVDTIMPSELSDEKLKTLLTMMSNNIDSISDDTTKKADAYVNNGDIENGYLIDDKTLITKISYDDYGSQLDIQDKEKKKVTDSTQKICVYTNNMFDNGRLLDEYKDLESDIKERDELLNESYERGIESAYRELGLKKDPKKAFFVIKDKDVFKGKLYQLFIQKQLPDNIVDGLDEVLDSDTKFLDLFSDPNKVEQVLLAFVKNNALKRKVNGESFVQVPSLMYSEELAFYSLDENGKTINMAEVMVPIPEEWNTWVKEIGGIDELNRRLRDGELEEKLGQFLANRIPTADINTIDAFKIKKFLPTYFGARIVLPKAIVAKTSSDFDVDKLTSYLNNYRMTNDGPEYIDRSVKDSEVEDRYINYVKELMPSDVISKAMAKEEETFNKIKEKKKATFGNIKDLYKEAIGKIDDIKSKKENLEENIESLFMTGHELFKGYEYEIKQEYWNLRSDHVVNNTDGISQIVDYISLTRSIINRNILDNDGKLIASGLLDIYEEEILELTKLMGATPEIYKEIREVIREAKESREVKVEHTKKYFGDLKHKILFKIYQALATNNDIIGIEEFGKLPISKQQSSKAIENRINEIHTKVLLHPARFKYLIRPHSANRLKGISEKIEKPLNYMESIERSFGDEYWMATQWWYNNMKADSFWGGKKVLSNTASNNTVNSLKQRFPIEVVGPLQNGTIFFSGQKPTNNENYIGGHRTDGKNDIADNHGQLLVAAVDVSTDDFIGKLAINNDTLGVLLYLNTHGLEHGVGLETIIKFLTHPVINEYLHELSLSRSQFLQHNQYVFKNSNWFYENVGNRTDIIKRVLGISTSEYAKLMYAKNKNYVNTKDKYKYLTDTDLKKNDKETRIQILDNFLTYQETAWKLAELHSTLRPYASGKFGKTLHGIENSIDKFDFASSEDQKIFNTNDIDNYINNSFLKGAQGVYNSALDMYGWMSLTSKYPALNGLLKEYVFSNFVTHNQKDYEDATKAAKNQFLSYIFTFYREPSELKGKYTSLITGKNSIPVRLRNIKQKLSDKGLSNEALDALIPSIKEFSHDIGRARENDYIYPMDKKMDISDQNTFTSALEELLSFKDSDSKFAEEVQQFARDFFEFSIYQNGVGNSPISYTRMLPNDRFVPLMDQVVDSFLKEHSKDMRKYVQSFSHQFFRNNIDDKNVVDRFKKPLSDGGNIPGNLYEKYGVLDDMVHKKSNAAKHEYISVRYYKNKKSERQENRRQGRKSAIEFLLYKRTEKTKGDYIVYELVDKLGDGFRFREYYPTTNGQDIESILSSNKYVKLSRYDVEKEEKEVKKSKPTTDNRIADVLYQIEASDIEPNEDLNNKMKDYLNALGVTYKAEKMIRDKFDTIIPAVAVAKFTEMTLEVVEGRMDIKTLPEETAHFYVKLLGEDSGLYKSMFNSIVNYPIYSEVSTTYSEIYNGDEKLIREEAIGKLIADRIVNGVNTSLTIRQQEQSNNWWTKLWNTIKELFTKVKNDPYTKAAYDILTRNVDNLTLSKTISETDMYQLKSVEEQWNELPFTAKGIYKYDYQRTTDSGERAYDGYISQFGEDNVSYIPVTDNTFKVKIAIKRPSVNTIEESVVQKEDNSIENIKELAKAPVPLKSEQLSMNFDTYFPDQSYLEQSEKDNIMKAIEGGDLIISCKY